MNNRMRTRIKLEKMYPSDRIKKLDKLLEERWDTILEIAKYKKVVTETGAIRVVHPKE